MERIQIRLLYLQGKLTGHYQMMVYNPEDPRVKDPELTDLERAVADLYDTGFWDFVENIKYNSKIIEIIEKWEEYKDKYGKSAEPTKDLKSVSNESKVQYDIRKEKVGANPDQRQI